MDQTSTEIQTDREDWYALSTSQVAAELDTNPESGISPEEAERRLEEYGPNELEKRGGPGPLKIFLRQFADILVIVLLVAAAVSFALGEQIDSIVIMAIVVVNSVLGFVQEYRAEQAVEALRKMAAPT
ncbi:MAG: cation-transporting P-type ATPase, partial [Armatimonadota bacterium]